MANSQARLDLIFGALADATRRAIVLKLSKNEASVGELAEPFDMALPSFMKHIRVLEGSGLIITEKRGRSRICMLRPDRLGDVEGWLSGQRTIWETRLDALERYVEVMKTRRS